MRKFIGVLVSAVGVFSLTKLHNLRTSTLQTLWRRNDGFRLFISDYHSDSSLEYSALQPSKQIVLNVMTSSPSSEKQQFCKDVIVLKDAYSSDNEVLRDFNSVRHIWSKFPKTCANCILKLSVNGSYILYEQRVSHYIFEMFINGFPYFSLASMFQLCWIGTFCIFHFLNSLTLRRCIMTQCLTLYV
jgi:hypothetical protein